MAIREPSNIGNCPVCGDLVTSYSVVPCTTVYVFYPCCCRSQTWTVIEGKFVGKSSNDYPPIMMTQDRRERLGRRVRQVWMDWAKLQPDCKPSWVVPWEDLSEEHREVDRRIGSAIWGDAVEEFSEQLANAAMKSLEARP